MHDQHEHSFDQDSEERRLPELRDPLSGPAAFHPGTLALPSTLLSWGSGVTIAFVLAALEMLPTGRPHLPLALFAASLATILAAIIAWAGHRRAGALFPRIWVLSLFAASALTTLLLVAGPDALGPPLTSLALALFAGAAALLPRLRWRRLVPHHRGLAAIGLVGPALGIAVALVLRIFGAMAFELLPNEGSESDSSQELAQLCTDLELAWSQDMTPLVTGLEPVRLDALEALGERLAAAPENWQPGAWEPSVAGTESALLASCAAAAAILHEAVSTAPTPSSLTSPAFEHRPRPGSAGTIAKNLPRDPGSACRLHRTLAATTRELAQRLEVGAPKEAADLRRTSAARRIALEADWLDGWLLPCFEEKPGISMEQLRESAAIESRLTSPPGLQAGRPDQWLQLSLAQAHQLAAQTEACALRSPYEDRQRRWQALDCVLLAPSPEGLSIVAELGLVYASKPRTKDQDRLPAILSESHPATLRLLIDAGNDGDLHSRAVRSLNALAPALAAAGGRFDPSPGTDPNDSAAWRFGLRFRGEPSADIRLEGTISKRILPGGREAVLLILRPTGAPS